MNTTNEKVGSALEELIIINNDRYQGYRTAAEETKDPDLKELFTKYSLQSQNFGSELRRFSNYTSDTPDRDETKLSGKFYRAWMDVKSAITGHDRKAILGSCEFGEDVALRSYNEALEDAGELPQEVLTTIQNQKMELQEAHDRIKFMRDSA